MKKNNFLTGKLNFWLSLTNLPFDEEVEAIFDIVVVEKQFPMKKKGLKWINWKYIAT